MYTDQASVCIACVQVILARTNLHSTNAVMTALEEIGDTSISCLKWMAIPCRLLNH